MDAQQSPEQAIQQRRLLFADVEQGAGQGEPRRRIGHPGDGLRLHGFRGPEKKEVRHALGQLHLYGVGLMAIGYSSGKIAGTGLDLRIPVAGSDRYLGG